MDVVSVIGTLICTTQELLGVKLADISVSLVVRGLCEDEVPTRFPL